MTLPTFIISKCSERSNRSKKSEQFDRSEDSNNPDLLPVASWSQILTPKRGFKVIHKKLVTPPQDWLNKCNQPKGRFGLYSQKSGKPKKLSHSDYSLLYAHYQTWKYSVDQNCGIIILENDSYSNQSINFTTQLMLAAQSMVPMGADIIYFGKYLDKPNLYQFEQNVYVSECKTVTKFPVYSTHSPFGSFAQYITPKAANRLIQEMYCRPETPENLAHYLIQEDYLTAWCYHPSFVLLNNPVCESFRYECQEPVCKPTTWTWGHVIWYAFLLLLLAIVVLVILSLLSTNFKCSPDQRASSGYLVEKCKKEELVRPDWFDC